VRFWLELAGIPIGTTELAVKERAIGVFEPFAAYSVSRVVFREGGNALWDLFTRPRQTARGRRWRANVVARMLQRAEGLGVRTATGLPIHAVPVFLFDSTRVDGPPVVVIHFGEAPAGVVAEVSPPGRAGAVRDPRPNDR
jgi:hypothetical protein